MASGSVQAKVIKVLGAQKLRAPYTVSAGGQYYTNLATLIDADKPSGSTVLGVIGFSTNNGDVIPVSIKYENTSYSLQIKSVGTESRTNYVDVYYLYES